MHGYGMTSKDFAPVANHFNNYFVDESGGKVYDDIHKRRFAFYPTTIVTILFAPHFLVGNFCNFP